MASAKAAFQFLQTAPEQPVPDSKHDAFMDLLAKGKERGWITFDELNGALPPKVTTAAQIEEAMTLLSRTDITVVEDSGTASDKKEEPSSPAPGLFSSVLSELPIKERAEMLSSSAENLAREVAAELVHNELAKYGKGLRKIYAESGLQPAVISRVATAAHPKGPELATLFKIALAMGKTLHLSFQDPEPDDD